MTHYLIVIIPHDEDLNPKTRTVIECDTRYTLDVDIPEWVKEEVDPKAECILLEPHEEL